MGSEIISDNNDSGNSDFVSRCEYILISMIKELNGDVGSIKSSYPGYVGSFDTELEFAIEHFDASYLDRLYCIQHYHSGISVHEDTESAIQQISEYIDYESFRNDIFEKEFFSLEVDGKIHVFKRG
jgi:hypothetical protein